MRVADYGKAPAGVKYPAFSDGPEPKTAPSRGVNTGRVGTRGFLLANTTLPASLHRQTKQ